MTIYHEEECKVVFDFDHKEVARQVIEAALDQEECPYEAEVSLTLTNDEEIHKVNKEFRGIDRPTDVLSFPMVEYEVPAEFDRIEEEQPDCFHPESGELVLGDILLSVDKVKEQADKYGHSELREYAFLIAHSMLHLLGYDHIDDEEMAKDMERRQEMILERLNIGR